MTSDDRKGINVQTGEARMLAWATDWSEYGRTNEGIAETRSATAGIGDCDDCHSVAPLFEVSAPEDGSWAICAQCAR